ncbi:hypothetical protein [Marinitoga sp. 38H-ov]|uniref:hypothetical protein n=1 Tax=Marinitoga sp. 38H-ov TaxID=1755814 RepID=UPI0013ED0649|nr:hypothetical protein [Marinitoga sp. 38H-ov]KAF2956409.1 hypothetical protein AS160_05745 [Marinitoga sp. 38H-ov]
MVMLKIRDSNIPIPDLEINSEEILGIYTNDPEKIFDNIIKIVLRPKKYVKEFILEGIDVENLSFFSRRIIHFVSSELWNGKKVIDILKSKSKNRKLIIISVKNTEDVFEISEYIEKNLKKESILLITNSRELIESVCDKVLDEDSNQLEFEEKTIFLDSYNNEEFDNIEEINKKCHPFIIKKRMLII